MAKEKKQEVDEEIEEVKESENDSIEKEAEDIDIPEISEVEELTNKFNEMEDKFLRARAEIANMSNRNKNEREQLVRYRSQDLGKKLLPAIDNLERALATEVTDDHGISLKKGVEMVLESLTVALKEEGITEIEAEGKIFDPNLHQAVQTVPAEGDTKPETIVNVLQKGYQLHDRVLRPAMVIVAQ